MESDDLVDSLHDFGVTKFQELLKMSVGDEPMASQNISVENFWPVSNIVTGFQFGAFSSNEKYIKKAKEIFSTGGLLSKIIFKGAPFKKEDNKRPRKYIFIGSMQVDVT
jgi:hypothetical protein